MKLSDIFDIKNGVSTTGLRLLRTPQIGHIPFLRPSSSQHKVIAGWIDPQYLRETQIFPAESLFVSTNGEGSHTYAYVFPKEFSCNSDVSVLAPKQPMSLAMKIFYARCITMNRFLFSYGRKPKGARLKAIDVPTIPANWDKVSVPELNWTTSISASASITLTPATPNDLVPRT